MRSRYLLAAVVSAAFAFGNITPGAAQSYPEKPVRIIIGFSAGGGTDIYSRLLGDNLSKILDQNFIVENMPGAATKIAAEAVARAPADGYTLFFTGATALVSNPHLYEKISYSADDFAPISLVATTPYTVMVGAKFPAQTFDDLIKLAKERPASIKVGSLGVGSGPYLVGKAVEQAFGLQFVEVPYKGSADAGLDLAAGRLDVYPDGMTGSLMMHKNGNGKIVAVMDDKRSPSVPDVPSIAELGHPELALINWFALVAPAGTPKEIIDKLNKATVEAVKMNNFSECLLENGVIAQSSTPEELGERIKSGSVTWRKLIESLHLKLRD
ncbi:tripartite tricarboxylate transporter substrate binding protein [Rhizobiales bacterium L72]|uniref:Tripartite tricarboxylate transporter substrate binding protein n=2 Tax=Propylenella binzhouense TaxID=2555902 RepID=A0A964T1R8_9HYPH|nr:tripartite tricarboxylate transporter substrate binding protein [Propylenella binzhouense]